VVTAGLALGYGYKQQIMVGHLTAEEMVEKSTINQLQNQLDSVTAKLNDMTTAQTAAKPQQSANPSDKTPERTGESTPPKKNNAIARSKAKRTAPVDKRYQQLQAQLEEEQKQLKETQELVAKNRADLEGNISATRDELNGSIAKTHEELVALEKRGERSYFEFELTKSKGFEREGPISLSLRKADTKHKTFNLEMVVDDNQLTKKNVNLYEPIWIHVENESQPVQIVVNKIEKNLVHGYVSAPKYKPSELAATTGSASLTPTAVHPQGPDANASSPKQPQ
jgi:predicted  nucleic acid-binding Zn-ribbon protein